ncbi:MAG: ATP-binding cassette domain-containing protein [Tannerellaceae bacterium]|jgi:ATPase subunit of ABC transporter with duplicated ATPase domains|nr:ATP-binding cassette domain-containing protein [Tannerellaceae bacterium]
MFILKNISYIHPNGELLFDNLNLVINRKDKIAIIGNNGAGKTTLLKIIAGEITCSSGSISTSESPYIIPQVVGQFDDLTIAEAIGIDKKLNALSEILSGKVTEENLSALNDDWSLEERCIEALSYWQLSDLDLNSKMKTLSGGEKTKIFLSGIKIHNPEIVLLDEPTNHLDINARKLLYKFIAETSSTIIVVSHDRTLLNKLDKICELNVHEIKIYGGNYDFYREQKAFEHQAVINDLEEKQKSLRKAKQIERESLERQQKMSERGKKHQKKEGTPKAMIDKMKNDSEKSTAHLKGIHADKINTISQELKDLQSQIPDNDKIKFGFNNSLLHKGKILVQANAINFTYNEKLLWNNNIDFQIISGERITIKGKNGSGKTTLLKLISGNLHPAIGNIYRAENKTVYIDQDYSLLNNSLSVYQQTQTFNSTALPEHEIKIRLNRFLFTKEFWDKPTSVLSGGEKMRLLICSLSIAQQSPDIIILDEPTNNIDIQNIEILTTAINEYQGTLIVVSHDLHFLEETGIEKEIILD